MSRAPPIGPEVVGGSPAGSGWLGVGLALIGGVWWRTRRVLVHQRALLARGWLGWLGLGLCMASLKLSGWISKGFLDFGFGLLSAWIRLALAFIH